MILGILKLLNRVVYDLRGERRTYMLNAIQIQFTVTYSSMTLVDAVFVSNYQK